MDLPCNANNMAPSKWGGGGGGGGGNGLSKTSHSLLHEYYFESPNWLIALEEPFTSDCTTTQKRSEPRCLQFRFLAIQTYRLLM